MEKPRNARIQTAIEFFSVSLDDDLKRAKGSRWILTLQPSHVKAPKWKPAAGSPQTLQSWFICNKKTRHVVTLRLRNRTLRTRASPAVIMLDDRAQYGANHGRVSSWQRGKTPIRTRGEPSAPAANAIYFRDDSKARSRGLIIGYLTGTLSGTSIYQVRDWSILNPEL